MSVRERDPLTGHETTGHEWAGITELNTRVPRAVWFFIAVTHIWALTYWVLMPAWPLVTTYTKGLLGHDERERIAQDVDLGQATRANWAERIEALPVSAIRDDPGLMRAVKQSAPALFGDNCAACHGQEARGTDGFPDLLDADWIWGGDAETILETLRVGINSTHAEARFAQMPAFGRDEVLSRGEVRTVADYVLSLSGTRAPAERLAAGAELFAANCASCHGDGAAGDSELGAPNLTDDAWIYGGDMVDINASVHAGRQGWMPAWEDRLSLADRKILTAYLLDQGEGAFQ